jgi:hypothetical protein
LVLASWNLNNIGGSCFGTQLFLWDHTDSDGEFPIGKRGPQRLVIVTASQPLASGHRFPNTAIPSRRWLWGQ